MRTLERSLNMLFHGPAKRRRAPDTEAADRRRFKQLAVRLGFTFVKTRDGYLELAACEAFPDGLVTAFHGWHDALGRVQHCVANPEAVADGSYSE